MKIREMQLDDLEQVMKIENENFSRPSAKAGSRNTDGPR